MIPTRVLLKGLTSYRRTVDLDLTELPEGLIAVVGPNGAGKTTLLEAMGPAALYRRFATRPGALTRWCSGRDARVLVEFDYAGQAWTLEQQINADLATPTTDAYAWRDGEALSELGRTGDYDAAVAAHLPDKSLLLASVFAAQNGSGNWLDMGKTERQALFRRLMRLDDLEGLSKRAGAHAMSCGDALAALQRKKTAAEDRRATLGDIRPALDAARAQSAQRAEAYEAAAKSYDEAVAEHAAAQAAYSEAWAARRAHDQRREELAGRVAERERQHDRAVAEVHRLRGLLDDADAIDRAVAERDRLQAERRALTDAIGEAASALEQATKADRGALEAARAELRDARQLAARRREEHILDASEAMRAMHGATERVRRAERAVELLSQVPCGGKAVDGVDCSTCPMLLNASDARDDLPALRESAVKAEAAVAALAEDKAVDIAQERVTDLEATAATLERDLASAREASDQSTAAQRREVAGLDQSLAGLADMLAKRDGVTAARARLPDVEARVADLFAEAKRAEGDLEAHDGAKPAAPDSTAVDAAALVVAERERDRGARRDEHEQAISSVSRLTAQVESLGDPAADLAELAKPMGRLSRLQSGFALVASGLGRSGVQALLFDAAGPTVSGLINDLLAAAYGGRFTTALQTIRPGSRGGLKEVFTLDVMDGRHGGTVPPEGLSGGERVLLDEALKLALAIYNARQGGDDLRTLWRDECAGALDADAAAAYPSILREARRLGDFHRVYFISHDERVWSQADGLIRIGLDGAVSLEAL